MGQESAHVRDAPGGWDIARTVAFLLNQPQDYVVSAGYARLLRQRASRLGHEAPKLLALVLADKLEPSVAVYAEELGPVELLPPFKFPPLRPAPVAWTLARIRALRRSARTLPLRQEDALVAYSFREFMTSVLLRALPRRPTLVRIQKCDDGSQTLDEKRPFVSLYYNAWNTLFGSGRMRYRWLPGTERVWTGTFLRDPYDVGFCIGPPAARTENERWIPYPFAALLEERPATSGRRTVVVLGELYPLHEAVDNETFRAQMNNVLAFVRASFPKERLVFKPRVPVDSLGFDLVGFEVAYGDVLLEELLLREPSIERVISVKSSGSAIATLYGREGFLLYPLFDLPAEFRRNLDAYFKPFRGSVHVVTRLEELATAERAATGTTLEQLEADAAPLLDVLAGAR